jgi:hypothetical protein
MKLLQEMRGLAEMTRRHPAPRPSALFLMQLRSHMTATSQSKRRLIITVGSRETPNIPDPVTITHVQPTRPGEPATV